MKQADYEILIACVNFGAPALAPSLITSLNKVVENSNSWTNEQRRLADEAHKAEIQKAEEAKKAEKGSNKPRLDPTDK